jgi:hypothetical protein
VEINGHMGIIASKSFVLS